ncbi:MAG: sugar transferase [Endomicrobiia bacterium]
MTRKNLWKIYILVKFLGDISLSIISFFIAYHIRFYNKMFISVFPPVKGIPLISKYYNFLPFFVLICIFTFSYCGNYKRQILNVLDEFIVSFKTMLILGILLFATSFFYRSYEYSRMFILLIVIVNFILILLWHSGVNYFYEKYSRYLFGKIRVGFVIFSKEKLEKIKRYLRYNKTVKKFFLSKIEDKKDIFNFVSLKNLSELVVDYEVFVLPLFQEILHDLNTLDIQLKILVSLPIRLSDTMIDSTLGIPVVSFHHTSLVGINYVIKRTIDIIISILVFTIFIIPGLFIALLIKLDSKGPIFYIQRRVGYKGRVFNCVKFRSMVKDAHKKWWDLLKYSERGDKVFKIKNDPRITRVGRFLRKFSIDEIPQFFNILKGDMSIVGPRPQIVEEASFYNFKDKQRLLILPGLTGLWQISGRADVKYEDMINLDLYYLENWTLGMDLKIILKTIFTVFSTKGAY